MTAADFVLVDESLQPVGPGVQQPMVGPADLRPSAETGVHVRIYQATGCGCVLHVHTIWNNLIAECFSSEGEIVLRDLEMIKMCQNCEEDCGTTVS